MGACRRRGRRSALHADGRRGGSLRAASTTRRLGDPRRRATGCDLGCGATSTPDALPCASERLRARASSSARSGTRSRRGRGPAPREHVDLVGSSGALGRREAGPAFFERIVAESGVAAREIALRRRPRRQRRRAGARRGHGRVHIAPRPVGPSCTTRRRRVVRIRRLASSCRRRRCLSSGSALGRRRARARGRACRSSLGGVRSTIPAQALRATRTAT